VFFAAVAAHIGAQACCSGCCEKSSMPDDQGPKANQLLAALPAVEWTRLAPHLVEVDMPLGQIVYESGGQLEHVYFPTTSIVSLLYVMEDGASAEIAIVGREGIVGIVIFMGGETTPSRAIVDRTKRRACVSGQCAVPERGMQPWWPRATPVASLTTGVDHADGADRSLQSASFDRPAIVPMAGCC
jgi:hypothetical protein